MRKSFLLLTALVISASIALGACEDSSKDTKKPSEEAAKKHKMELVYYEVLNNGDADDAKTDVAYRDKGSSKIKHYHPSLDHVYEHILSDGNEKPYVVKDGKKFFIYRPPYMTYGDDDFSGKVEDKSDVKK
ncbi:hypothetical protein N9R04_08040 [Staphylococcus sp. SQ8-PEA]|uniref:Lipoprotein n=1 Tax=Staphylococcus marylandisciuri TaxID=2981529 RepID=A0ABT2QRP0_9STAP|nr:hypothetical protein [Staphylococcus marylandisciuri]MCU5746658.1 hypothetical protein [Staphylococcus marylandisciuri]